MREVKKSKKSKKTELWDQFQAKSLYEIENIYYNWRQFAQLKNQESLGDEGYLRDLESSIASELEDLGNEIFNYLSQEPRAIDYLAYGNKDIDNLYAHVFRVALKMGLIALRANYSEKQIKHGIMGSLIHDFGLVIENPILTMDYWIDHKVKPIEGKSYSLGQRYLEMNTEICPEIKCLLVNSQFKQKPKERSACSSYNQCSLGIILGYCDVSDHHWIELKKRQLSEGSFFKTVGHCS